MKARKREWITLVGAAVSAAAGAQVPDLMNAIDAGGRAMGMGGSIYASDSNTFSISSNPAGLAFINEPTLGLAFRNLPQSSNTLSGSYLNPTFSTSTGVGSRALSHFGFAMPLKTKSGTNGTLGFAYTLGGYIRDERGGANLDDGDLTIKQYAELLQARTDFYTLAWGKPLKGDAGNIGLGIVVANQYIRNERFISYTNPDIPNDTTSVSGNGSGIGVLAGFQFSPKSSPNTSVGLSVRTPINLQNNAETSSYFDKIPGRASLGLATRIDNVRGGEDFVVYGAQADYYFGGENDKIFARKNYATFGAGFEYNLHKFDARIPIRFGYNVIPSGGDGFGDRNAFTFGIGYRPKNGDFGVDLNFAAPSRGGKYDMSLALTYKLGK